LFNPGPGGGTGAKNQPTNVRKRGAELCKITNSHLQDFDRAAIRQASTVAAGR
jgi:hypothetical protein